MFSKVNMLRHPHNIVVIIWVFIHEELEKFSFRLSELMINLCIPIDFYSDYFTV